MRWRVTPATKGKEPDVCRCGCETLGVRAAHFLFTFPGSSDSIGKNPVRSLRKYGQQRILSALLVVSHLCDDTRIKPEVENIF